VVAESDPPTPFFKAPPTPPILGIATVAFASLSCSAWVSRPILREKASAMYSSLVFSPNSFINKRGFIHFKLQSSGIRGSGVRFFPPQRSQKARRNVTTQVVRFTVGRFAVFIIIPTIKRIVCYYCYYIIFNGENNFQRILKSCCFFYILIERNRRIARE
jgi:hypothetical protein